MFRLILTTAAMLSMCSCAVTKQWTATGGSRADGTVKLSYEYGLFQQPKLDESQAVTLAGQRCIAWGYESAEAFGGVNNLCTSKDSFGSCTQWLVTKEYQCIGKKLSD